jgi:hypothetical protein
LINYCRMNCCAKYSLLIIISLTNAFVISAQLGDAIYNHTFGEGNADPNTIGPQLNSNIY